MIKCMVMAEGASYEFTDNSLASAQIKSCPPPIPPETRLPPSSLALKRLDTGDCYVKCPIIVLLFLASCVCILPTKGGSNTSCAATFSFYTSTANIIVSPSTANSFQTICTCTYGNVVLFVQPPSAALLSITVFLCLQL